MADALLRVRAELGSDAVVVHTRSVRRGGFLGFGSQPAVEVTAEPGRAVGQRRRAQAMHSPRAEAIAASRGGGGGAARGGAGLEAVGGATGDLIKKTYAAAMAEMQWNRGGGLGAAAEPAAAAVVLAPAPAPARAPAPAPTPTVAEFRQLPEHRQLIEEMRAVKGLVTRMMRAQSPAALERATSGVGGCVSRPAGDPLFDQYVAMIEAEVAEELAEEVIATVRGRLRGDDVSDSGTCRDAVRQELAGLLHVDEEAGDTLKPPADGRPRTIALVGPTGVGKTTTIAKLAATFRLKQDLSVGLITLDTYRIAAVEQLRTYAQIIGVPLHVAAGTAELERAIRACRGCDVVLIDTAGRSPRNADRLHELAELIAVAEPHEVHLVLASTCKQREMMETVARFSEVRTDRIIFTKLDEASTFGTMLNVARAVDKKLSYLTTGQSVPHMIEATRPERLAALVMGDPIIPPPSTEPGEVLETGGLHR